VAHDSLEFIGDEPDITSISFVNYSDSRPRAVLWKATFQLADLREFLGKLADEVEKACGRWRRR